MTYIQCDDRWKDIQVGTLTIAQSAFAFAFATICNAVYYLTGREMDPVETAFWANGVGLFYRARSEGERNAILPTVTSASLAGL